MSVMCEYNLICAAYIPTNVLARNVKPTRKDEFLKQQNIKFTI